MNGRPTGSLPRLSAKEALILELLGGSHAMYGLQLVTESAGRLKRGTVYVTLGRMEEKGYVKSRPGEMTGRRIYGATPHGVRVLKAWRQLARLLEVPLT